MRSAIMIFICVINCFIGMLSLSGCSKQTKPMPEINTTNPPAPTNDTSYYSYLALGDSYTIGQGVTEKERFPFLLTEILRQEKLVASNLKYIAQTGWSTIALQNAIEAGEPLGNFDVVTLLIGVNDQYQHLDTTGYRTRFTQLLSKSIALAKNNPKRVFVLSIPDYSATPFVAPAAKEKIRQEIDAFNTINKEISLQYNISYTDITGLSRKAATDHSLLANDGLHYSAVEHLKWAEKLALLIRATLK